MEGMIYRKVVAIQKDFVEAGGCNLSLKNWAKGLVMKLFEATHGQWLYRNVVVHDVVGGLEAVKRKQELQSEIERQIELGREGLVLESENQFELRIQVLLKFSIFCFKYCYGNFQQAN